MKTSIKILFTFMSAVLIAVALFAINDGTYRLFKKGIGYEYLVGDEAAMSGKGLLIVAVLPLLVWLPKKMVGWSIVAWWFAFMGWIFIPFTLGEIPQDAHGKKEQASNR